MQYKHKFHLNNGTETFELAVCLDEMTATFLKGLYKQTYRNSKDLKVTYSYNRNKETLINTFEIE